MRSRASFAAAGSSPAGMAQSIARPRSTISSPSFDSGIFTFDCADIYTGVEELIRRLPGARQSLARRGGLSAHPRPHQAGARSHDARPYRPRLYPGRRRALAQAPRAEALDLVQFHWWSYATPGLIDAVLLARRIAPRGQGAQRRPHQFRYEAFKRSRRSGRAGAERAGAIFGARSAAGKRPRRALREARRLALVLRFGRRRFLERPLARRAGAHGALREPFAGQIQAHYRRFRRLGAVPGIAARAAGASPTATAPTSRPSPAAMSSTSRASRRSSSARATAPMSPTTRA